MLKGTRGWKRCLLELVGIRVIEEAVFIQRLIQFLNVDVLFFCKGRKRFVVVSELGIDDAQKNVRVHVQVDRHWSQPPYRELLYPECLNLQSPSFFRLCDNGILMVKGWLYGMAKSESGNL